MSITEKKRKSSENNIFWSAGFDSTFILCKKLIIDKEKVTPYYLDFDIEYNFKDILEKTWSCRWLQFNGQRCTKHSCPNMCIESQEFIKEYDFKRAYSIK